MSKMVYLFEEGNADMRNLLGGKGANLAEMTNLGLPIPQGFTVTTEACTDYYNNGRTISEDIQQQIFTALADLEKKQGKKFGDTENPLLVSVRSGARASMPGMMDTILNLGLNDVAVEGFAKKTGNPRFAYDSYRRFIQMFSDVVMEVPKSLFERVLDEIKAAKQVKFDMELTAEDLQEVIARFKAIYKDKMGEDFPQDPKVQLMEAVKAVFRSWDNERAIVYRRMNDIPGDWGTAVNVQAMVFGNMGETSGTGVAFTRNPSTGAKGIYGEYLINAQGEDVVAGIRTPQPITKLEQDLPECYKQFMEIAMKLEAHYRDMQDMEFTIENGKLFFAPLAYASEVLIQADKTGIADDAVSVVIDGATLYIPFAELVDIKQEIERLEKEEKRLGGEIARANGMLNNEKFTSKAPAQKVAEEREKLTKYTQMLEKVQERLAQLK